MNYSGNMPDWHQYNPPPAGRTSSVGAQNASSHVYISGTSPPALDGINMTAERHRTSKHQQNEGSYAPVRSYPGAGTTMHMSGGLAGCHYGTATTRNPMMDNLPIGMPVPVATINEDVAAHRNGPITYVSPTNNPNSVVNSSTVMHATSIPSQNSPLGPVSPGRAGVVQPYVACKAPCCNPEAVPYQHWDKFVNYPNGHASSSYRDNIRQSTVYPAAIDNRRFLPDINVRKDCHDNKDLIEASGSYSADHRTRNFPDYAKYSRKDGAVPRNYPSAPSSLVHQNYPMQSYNFPSDYQKCPYSGKEYVRRGNNGTSAVASASSTLNSKNSSLMKYHEQQSVIVQQKYQHSKQMQYQNGNPASAGLSSNTGSSSANNISASLQNSYFNAGQLSRDYQTRDYHSLDQTAVGNRLTQNTANSHIHGTFQKYHVYQQKIAMQRFSLENHLRSFIRIPGYQTHPKYQECVMRYREILRLQQSIDYPNVIQESPKVPSPTGTAGVPPINLQFDQNGLLINSSYIPPGTFTSTGIHGIPVTSPNEIPNNSSSGSGDANNRRISVTNENFEPPSHYLDHNNERTTENGSRSMNHENTNDDGNGRYLMPNDKKDRGRYEQTNERGRNESLNSPSDGVVKLTAMSANTTMEYKNSKDFADKPELDVRQFLANWDESEDEDTNVTSVTAKDKASDEFSEAVKSSDEKGSTNDEDNGEKVSSTDTRKDETIVNETEIILKNIQEIECIRTDDDIDDIPTIHIVENLDAGEEIDKIHTVFGSLTSAILNPISICENTSDIVGEVDAASMREGETIVLFERDEVSAKILEFSLPEEENDSSKVAEDGGSIVESVPADKSEINQQQTAEKISYDDVRNDDNEKPSENSTENPSGDLSEERSTATTKTATTTTTTTATTSSTSGNPSVTCVTSSNSAKNNNPVDATNLRKQNSFASDESHNPDDISLPDLQTSECTPISTTLNTPQHSDSEESSEHVSDLTISTNPIEIMQNSPIISFTHSPIKIEPYEQLNGPRMIDDTVVNREHDSLDFDFDEEVASNENRKYNENCDSSPASVVEELENQARESTIIYKRRGGLCEDNKNDDFNRDPLVGMGQSPVSRETTSTENLNEDRTSAIEDNGDELDNDEERTTRIMERDDDRGDDDNDDFNHSEDLEKLCDISLDDACIMPLLPGDDSDEPRMPVSPIADNCLTDILNDNVPIADLNVLESSDNSIVEKPHDDIWNRVESSDKDFEANSSFSVESSRDGTTKKIYDVSKSVKVTKNTNKSSSNKLTRHNDDKNDYDTSRSETICRSSDFIAKERVEKVPSANEPFESTCDESRKKCCGERLSRDDKDAFDRSRDISEIEEKNEEDDSRKAIENMNYLTKHHRDPNVEIQVANFNVKIHNDNETTRGDTAKNQESIVEAVGAIEININLSRGDIGRMISKSIEEKLIADEQQIDEKDRKKRDKNDAAAFSSEKKNFRKRRRSMPETIDNFEIKRTRRKDEMEETVDNDVEHYVAKQSVKRRNRTIGRNRKIRRSMDDELLTISAKHTRRENVSPADETNFRDGVTKNLHLLWPRDTDTEMTESRASFTINDNDEKICSSARCRIDARYDKHMDTFRLPSPSYNSSFDNSSNFDFDNFDVAPNCNGDNDDPSRFDSTNDDHCAREKSRYDERERYRNPTNNCAPSVNNYYDDSTRIDAFERNLNTVPIYTTKDGRITYSPNRNYTYRALIKEARQREKRRSIVRKFNSSMSRNRDATQRKTYKRRVDEMKLRDCKPMKSKRSSTLREFVERETIERATMRLRQHESRRNSSIADARTLEFESSTIKNDKSSETMLATRKSVIDDRVDLSSIIQENVTTNDATINDELPTNGEKNFPPINCDPDIVTKMFDDHKSEISSEVATPIVKRPAPLNERETPVTPLRFFRNSSQSPKTTMASPATSLVEKRPAAWDLEHYCQTALSDSGLESSTTYVEARKVSRRLQRWKNSLVDRSESVKTLFSMDDDKKIHDDANNTIVDPLCDVKILKIEPTVEMITTIDNDEMSEIVQGLDLAITRNLNEGIKKKRRRKKKERENDKSKRIIDIDKTTEMSFRRCVSSDSGEFTGAFFQIPIVNGEVTEIHDHSVNNESTSFRNVSENFAESGNNETQMTTTISQTVDQRPLTSENFHESCKDYLIDTCTSFSSFAKMPEPPSGPAECEASQLEDTSTRFASESMDFKDEYTRTDEQNVTTESFTFSCQPMTDCSIAARHDTIGGDSFLTRIEEDASVLSSRNSVVSARSKDSGKAPILSFAGQIQNDSSLGDSPSSKSPPDLTRENDAFTKIVVAKVKNEKSLVDEILDVPIVASDGKITRADNDTSYHPKIPKMIIRNIKSRPGTPNAVDERDERKKEIVCETKIPKMTIKLEDNQLPRMVTEKAVTSDDKRLKIRKIGKSSNGRSTVTNEKLPLVGKLSRQSSESEVAQDFHESTENSGGSYKFTLMEKSSSKHHHHHRRRSRSREKTSSSHHRRRSRSKEKSIDETKQDRVPKLTIKKQSSQTTINIKKRRSQSPGEGSNKKRKGGTCKLGTMKKEETRSRERRRNSMESNEGNNDSHQSLSEKIPKVIIKRASPSAEFKCELSKNDAIIKDSKWQPEVKLRRFWVLDCMAKEPGNGQVALKVLESTMDDVDKEIISNEITRKNHKWNSNVGNSAVNRDAPYDGKTRRKSECELTVRGATTCKNRRKSFESENLELSITSEKFKGPLTGHSRFSTRSECPDDEKKLHTNDKRHEDDERGKIVGKKSVDITEETEGCVIKIDSSDESQTTIEILPASPDPNSQTELDVANKFFQPPEHCDVGGVVAEKLYSDDAIPTQFELELEIVDNSTVDSLDVPLPPCLPINETQRSTRFDDENVAIELGFEKFYRKNVCCSDSLVKEVLAAKETLKRCLTTRSKSVVGKKPRPKTAAEKKQGSGYDYIGNRRDTNEKVEIFEKLDASYDVTKVTREKKVVRGGSNEREEQGRYGKNSWINDDRRANFKDVSTIARSSRDHDATSASPSIRKKTKKSVSPNCRDNSRCKSTPSRKGSSSTECKNIAQPVVTSRHGIPEDSMSGVKSYKIPKISRNREINSSDGSGNSNGGDNGNEPLTIANDEKRKSPSPTKMPVLVPQTDISFELARRESDRDTSRSPPVITKQVEPEIQATKNIEEIINSDKLDGIEKQRDTESVTFADIVSQLAYHEKATIRHRRYCTLCERWFPTAARHRRHLTGYQHRHTELTQRRTVHALFMLFTGKPCPRLLPASIVRTDCSPGEPTPLQIAVQDVAISLEDGSRVAPNKDTSEKDE